MIFPGQNTSGGLHEAKIIPQMQTVQALAGSGVLINDIYHYSGQVNIRSQTATSGSEQEGQDYVWIVERNHESITSGLFYPGKATGYSADPAAMVYEVSKEGTAGDVIVETTSGTPSVTVGTLTVPEGSFTVTEPSAGTALVSPDYGTVGQIADVAGVTAAGTAEQFARADHVHKLTTFSWGVSVTGGQWTWGAAAS